MTLLESKLTDALNAGAATVFPAPDLFARVHESVAADRLRRRLLARNLRVASAVALVAAVAATFTIRRVEGRLVMKWWVLELLTTLLLGAVALWLGPFIKRFGRGYAADVFRASPRTGKSFIVLTDIVYYLIFTAYILFTVSISPRSGWAESVRPQQIADPA
jgi:hypothetical protein